LLSELANELDFNSTTAATTSAFRWITGRGFFQAG
jgi:hypothetical protein